MEPSSELPRIILEHLPVGIAVADREGRLISVNPAFSELLGYGAADLEAVHYGDLVHPHDLAADMARFEKLVSGRATSYSIEERAITKSGENRWVQVLVTLLPAEEDGEPKVLAAILDIEARKRLETELLERRKMEALARLTGGVAHDFNNMLTIIRGELELIIDPAVEAEIPREPLERVMKTVDQAAHLTRQLLAFGRQQVLREQRVELNEVVRGSEDVLRRIIPEDIEFELVLAKELPKVAIDPAQIVQLVLNLLLNARDATDSGGSITLRTYSRPLPAGGPAVVLEISDSGHGMTADVMTQLFEPFYTTKETGTGLGLATSYGIAKQSGGDIEAYSEPGIGSVFRVVLPCAHGGNAPQSDEELMPRSENNPPAVPSESRGELVLLIEDEAGVRSVVRRALLRAGCRVIEASDGEEAVAALEADGDRIQLVLSDVILPGIRWEHLWREMRRFAPAAPVVFMSGYAKDLVEQKVPPGAVRWFIEKPFQIPDLLETVGEALDAESRSGPCR